MQPIAGLMRELAVDPAAGLDESAVIASRQRFGSNALQPPPRESVWRKFLAKFDEPIIKILLAAALLKFVVDLFDAAHGGTVSLGVAALIGVAALFAVGSLVPP